MYHFQTVGIEPELSLSVEIAKEFPIYYNIFAPLLFIVGGKLIVPLIFFNITDWNIIEINLELQKIWYFGELNDCS